MKLRQVIRDLIELERELGPDVQVAFGFPDPDTSLVTHVSVEDLFYEEEENLWYYHQKEDPQPSQKVVIISG